MLILLETNEGKLLDALGVEKPSISPARGGGFAIYEGSISINRLECQMAFRIGSGGSTLPAALSPPRCSPAGRRRPFASPMASGLPGVVRPRADLVLAPVPA